MRKVGVIGTGTMGSGIAQAFAQSGYFVVMNDISEAAIERAKITIQVSLEKFVSKGKIKQEDADAALSRISGSTNINIMSDVDLVVEAATENPEAKKKIFKQLGEITKDGAILASNTSSLSITELAVASGKPDRVVGMHFFNPVPLMQLVEVIKGYTTSDEVKDAVMEVARSISKTPVEVPEAPGFVVNRLLIPLINEAIVLYEKGGVSAEDIDIAMKLGANFPIGPLALGDMIGLDVVLAIMNVLHDEFGDPKYSPAPLLRMMVRGGKLGRKTGEGFFKYEKR